MENIIGPQELRVKLLSNEGLTVQEIAYREGIEVSTVQGVLCVNSFINNEGELSLL